MRKFTPNEMLEKSIAELSELESGQEFILKDLFKGYIWGNQDLGTRRTLGSLFLNYCNSEENAVEILDKSSSYQQRYRKK